MGKSDDVLFIVKNNDTYKFERGEDLPEPPAYISLACEVLDASSELEKYSLEDINSFDIEFFLLCLDNSLKSLENIKKVAEAQKIKHEEKRLRMGEM